MCHGLAVPLGSHATSEVARATAFLDLRHFAGTWVSDFYFHRFLRVWRFRVGGFCRGLSTRVQALTCSLASRVPNIGLEDKLMASQFPTKLVSCQVQTVPNSQGFRYGFRFGAWDLTRPGRAFVLKKQKRKCADRLDSQAVLCPDPAVDTAK